MKKDSLRALLTSVAMMLPISGAYAQSASSSTAAAPETAPEAETTTVESRGVADIVVTAQRREENLQRVPISVQAFSEETLRSTGALTMTDLPTITPSLHVGNWVAAVTPFIRGVGSPDGGIGQEPAVAIYVDGVYNPNPIGSLFSFNDVQRIEVLKGPQGTLFGRNATGGIIQVVSKDPDDVAGGTARLSYGNYDRVSGDVYVTTGVAPGIAADFSAYYVNQADGYGRNLTLDEEVGKKREYGFKGKLLFEPSDGTTIRLSADYANIKTSIGVFQGVALGSLGADGQLIFAGCVAGLGGNPAAPTPVEAQTCTPVAQAGATPPPPNWQDTYAAINPLVRVKTYGMTGRIDQELGELQLTSITGYRRTRSTSVLEQSMTRLSLVDIIQTNGSNTFSQELQLSGKSDAFRWVAGLFFYADKQGYLDPEGLGLSGAFFSPATAIFGTVKTRSYAAFAQGTYSISDTTRFTAGIRMTLDRRHVESRIDLAGIGTVLTQDAKDSFKRPTWRLVLDHDFTPTVMGYVSYNRGFKSGSFNLSSVGQPSFDPETLDSYEAGLKSKLFDNRLVFNAAAFLYKYRNLQVNKSVAGALQTINAASAEIKGLEAELTAQVSDRLRLRGGLSFIDSEYTRFPNADIFLPSPIGGAIPAVADLTGNRLPYVSKFSGSVGGSYTVPVGEGELELVANLAHRSGLYWMSSNRTKQKAYDLLSLSAGWKSEGSGIGVRVFGNNVLGEKYAITAIEQGLGDSYAPAAPFTFGVEVSFGF